MSQELVLEKYEFYPCTMEFSEPPPTLEERSRIIARG